MAKMESRMSPIGEIQWAHIHEPKKAFDGDGDGKFEITLVFDKGGEWDSLCGEIAGLIKENDYTNQLPKHEVAKNEAGEYEETKRWALTFKTKAEFPPKVVDRYGDVIPSDIKVANKSTGRVMFKLATYKGFGGGVTLYLNSVQVWDLIPYEPENEFPVDEDKPVTGDNNFPVDAEDPIQKSDQEEKLPF